VTGDDTLWPQLGAHVGGDLVLKQVDSIDELLTATPAGLPAIVLWDARNQTDAAGALSRLQLHSPRLAVIALDEASGAHTWTNPIALRQVVAHVVMPILAANFMAALESAHEEVNVRIDLLGDGSAAATDAGVPAAGVSATGSPAEPSGPRSIPWIPVSIIAGVLIACVGTFVVLRHGNTAVKPAPEAGVERAVPPFAKAPAGADEKVDLLVEKAEQAMRDRHFIDPRTAARSRCIEVRCFSIPTTAKPIRDCSVSLKFCLRGCSPRWTNGNSTSHCSRWKLRAASIPATAAYPPSTSASPAYAPSSVRRRFRRRSTHRISTARRS